MIIMQSVENQTTSIEFMVPILPLLIIGWIIAIILLVSGVISKKNKLIGTGICLIGIMTVVTPLAWYGYRAISDNGTIMTFIDILILTFLTLIGGMIITYGIYTLKRNKKIV